ncbi:unnamed protein product, partial [marine sediment metagenome]
REEMRFRALEAGELCHSILRQLMKNIYSDKKGDIESIPLDQLQDQAKQMVDHYIDRRFPRLLETGLEKVRRNRIVRALQNFITKERQNQQQNQTTPRYFELAFSKPREEEQQDEKSIRRVLEIDCGDGRSLFLAGRIDRVDVFSHMGAEYGVIIDYKLRDRGSIDFENGQSLQCPLYMLALDRIFGIKAAASFLYA